MRPLLRGSDGEKLYKFRILTRREAARVFHNSIKLILKALSGLSGDDKSTKIVEAIDSLDFDHVWNLAKVLLKNCIISPNMENPQHMITISNLDETDYFDDCREELYIALYYSLKANYPKSFSRVAEKLQGFSGDLQKTFQ